jgi:curli production assembly/transport component CsgG
VHTTKSILSQKLDGGVFRYVDTNELLESEIGITFNEPSVMAVTEAIDEAVKLLIIEGVEDNLWQPANDSLFTQYVRNYERALAHQKEQKRENYYGLTQRSDLRRGFSLTANYSFGSHIGSYGNETQNSGIFMQLEQSLSTSPALSLKLNMQRSQIGSKQVFSEPVNNAELLLNSYLTADFRFSPYVAIGGGVLAYDSTPDFTDERIFPSISAEAGIDYRFSDNFGFKLGFNYRYFVTDGIDGVKVGNIHDQQWNIITGISIYPF